MGIEPFLIASTIRAVVGQRLVRKLCVDCREQFKPETAFINEIDGIFGVNAPANMKHIHALEEQALAGGIGASSSGKSKVDTAKLSTTETKITTLYRPHDGGCASCSHTGYRGRMGIYEVLAGSSEIQQQIIAGATSEQIQDTAIKAGMVTMQLDGFIKALRGQTSVEEILRVTTEK
jgi:type IV pilus assembly protein PilB